MLIVEKGQEADGCIVCRVVGELDLSTVTQLRDSLADLAGSPRLVLDLSDVPFVDSAGLGALVGGIRRVREHGGDVVVACSRRTLGRLLRMTGFEGIVTVTETVSEALAALTAREPVSPGRSKALQPG
jgi:anti-sigma B factor antagonist